MAAFATPSELASSLEQDVDTATATLALNRATAKIRKAAGDWSITQEVGAVATLDGSSCHSLWLPSLLVTAVTSVVEDSVALTVVTGFDWTSYGKLIRVNRCWTWKPRAVVVTYTHGYATVPDDVKDICLAVAGRLYRNPGALQSKTVGGVAWTAAGDSAEVGGGLTESELEDLTPYRLAAVA